MMVRVPSSSPTPPWHGNVVGPSSRPFGIRPPGVEPARVMSAPDSAVEHPVSDVMASKSSMWMSTSITKRCVSASCGVAKELGIPDDRLNLHGEGCGGWPSVGCVGDRCLITMLGVIRRLDAVRGIVTLCLGGGNAVAMLIERPIGVGLERDLSIPLAYPSHALHGQCEHGAGQCIRDVPMCNLPPTASMSAPRSNQRWRPGPSWRRRWPWVLQDQGTFRANPNRGSLWSCWPCSLVCSVCTICTWARCCGRHPTRAHPHRHRVAHHLPLGVHRILVYAHGGSTDKQGVPLQ